jgi:glucose/mannose-6-phosphate isomerase
MDIKKLDDKKEIERIDREDMLGEVNKFPEMLREAVAPAQAAEIGLKGSFDGVVISGMGGSAICGDVVRGAFEEQLGVPVFVNRSYSLPGFIKGNVLFVAVSYSGNTEETLSSLKEAEARALKIVVISSGGELTEIARRKKYPLLTVPSGIQPRAALPHLLVSLLIALEKLSLLRSVNKEIDESIKLLPEVGKSNSSKELAGKLFGRIPLILAADGPMGIVALRWVTQFNENSKMMAHLSILPEMAHNEIVGIASRKDGARHFAPVILRDSGENPRVAKRIEIIKPLIKANMGEVAEVWSSGNGVLARMLSLILFGDFLSVYLAVLGGVDPTPVEVISRMKKELLK